MIMNHLYEFPVVKNIKHILIICWIGLTIPMNFANLELLMEKERSQNSQYVW